MRWPVRHKRYWRRAFALVPVQVETQWTWLEWYYVSRVDSRTGEFDRQFGISRSEMSRCADDCAAGYCVRRTA